MTRNRKNLKDQGQQPNGSAPQQPRRGSSPSKRRRDGPEFLQVVGSENWKQQQMVVKGSDVSGMTMMMHMVQLMAMMGMGAFAAREGGVGYTASAICAAGYTVATINNSFDRNLHGLIGFLDSPIMITMLSGLLAFTMFGAGGPASMHGWIGFILCCIPFFGDMLISARHAIHRLTSDEPQRSGCTVEELTPANEENFLSMNERSEETKAQEQDMFTPSERIMPDVLRDNQPINNLLSRNWKERAYESTNATVKQLTAFALILGYMYLGGMAVESNAHVPLGAISLVYAASSLLGYFGLANAPVARLARVNGVSAVCAVLGVGSLLSSGVDAAILAMTAMHAFDAFQGTMQEEARALPSDHNEFERIGADGETTQQNGPVASFFVESWKVNAFNRRNYETCQTVQILMFGAQLFAALVCMADGGSPGLLSAVLAVIVAGAYSFFSPVRVAAIDALQSNGAQLAVLGAATHQIVTASPAVSFYALFCLLAADTMMSCSTFFQEHQNQMGRTAGAAMGLLEKDGRGGSNGHGDYNRQM